MKTQILRDAVAACVLSVAVGLPWLILLYFLQPPLGSPHAHKCPHETCQEYND